MLQQRSFLHTFRLRDQRSQSKKKKKQPGVKRSFENQKVQYTLQQSRRLTSRCTLKQFQA